MSDYQPVLLLFIFMLPVLYMIDTSLVILRRNSMHIENRLASLTTALLALMISCQYVQQLLPMDHTLQISAYVVYPISLAAACLSVLLHLRVTSSYHRISMALSSALAFSPLIIYLLLLLLKGPSFYFIGVRVEGPWKQPAYVAGFFVVIVTFLFISICNVCLCLVARKRSTTVLLRKRYTVLFKANLYYHFATFFVLLLIVLLSSYMYIDVSFVGIASVIWSVSIRHFMKYDVLPSVKKKFELLYHLSPTAILMLDRHMLLKEANPGAVRLLGYDNEAELKNKVLLDFIVEADRLNVKNNYTETFPLQKWRNYEVSIKDRGGKQRVILMDTERITEGEEGFVLAVIRDITQQKEEELLIHFLAHHDTLTNLPNRYHFTKELENSLLAVREKKSLLGVMLIDLDRFKLINDTLGHQYGDEALVEVAKRLLNSVNKSHLLARLGGDEFIILIKDASEYDEIVSIAENIHQIFQLPITLQGQDFYLGGSIGISVHPFDDDTPNGLIKQADIAMYNAKHSGGNQYRLYTNAMIALVQRDVRLEKNLRKALELREFVLYYQPQIDLASGRLIGAEALIRWNSAELGMVQPGEFITLAEQTGLINEIGQWVIAEACEQGRLWQERGWNDFMLSVNVSSRQFMQPDFVNKVQETLRSSGLEPGRLCLEITESMVVNNLNVARKMLDELVALGIHIAIDDFGTGYSSLSVLRQLPIAIIKIDRSFITDMNAYESGLSIVKTIVSMGHDLQKQVVAEGVETIDQLEQLKQLGCDKAQGYYYHKPLPLQEFNKLLSDR
ncbi:EAL domain-containing protein [Paenibacillus luteus]|uniref:EAL domain-containing protein n=1 Tax=Paenibacillus luteus TaxID=2545753 RepID=UPI0011447FBF|nr:EAL domain-containing protein [Paenibacillus luteus]